MAKITRFVAPALVVLAAASGLATVMLYSIALGILASGPSIGGYDWLDVANRSTWLVAAFVVVATWAGRFGKGVAVAAGALALASGVVGVIALGLWVLGLSLSGFQSVAQPLGLNSLLLAVAGTGYIVAPAAMVLAVGAFAVAVTPMIRKRFAPAMQSIAPGPTVSNA